MLSWDFHHSKDLWNSWKDWLMANSFDQLLNYAWLYKWKYTCLLWNGYILNGHLVKLTWLLHNDVTWIIANMSHPYKRLTYLLFNCNSLNIIILHFYPLTIILLIMCFIMSFWRLVITTPYSLLCVECFKINI